MRHFAVLGIGLVCVVALADDTGPLPGPGEYEALRLIGRMIGQEVVARRCDALLEAEGLPRSPPRVDQHRAVLHRLRHLLERARGIADGYYQSVLSDGWQQARDAQFARLRAITESRPIDTAFCMQLGIGMDRQIAEFED